MQREINRRDFVKQGSLTVAGLAAMSRAPKTSGAATETAPMPLIELGSLRVSRLILGSNTFYGFAHQTPELSQEMTAFFTDERIMGILDEAAAQGITAVASPPYERWIRLFRDYLARGGKLRTWISQPDGPADQMEADIEASVRGGAQAVFIQGMRVDEQFEEGRHDVVRGWVERIKGLGVPAGTASHRPDTHLIVEERGFPTDFYFQCFFDPREGYREEDRQKVVAALPQQDKPVIVYKILGAGRLPAPEAFEFAFRHLQDKDGVCVGMFPQNQPGQVAENARLAREFSTAGNAG